MAWTWSAPRRGTVAGAAVLYSGHRALHRATLVLGRGDAGRGLCVGFAAFLTIVGMAAPHLQSDIVTAILCLSGAALVAFVATAPTSSPLKRADQSTANAETIAKTERPAASQCIQELLAPAKANSACDRAAFARLTAHMSHELRTPLNAILGFSEMMSAEVFGPLGSSAYASYARDIHASGLSLLKSAEDALAITALLTATEQNRSTRAHASTAALEALRFHAVAFQSRGISADCTVDDEADILSDPHAMRQLLINLIATASDRAAPGARLSVASRADGDHIEILVTVAGAIAHVDASDNRFSLLLARTLAELSGATLTTDPDSVEPAGEWQLSLRVERATQNDFFAVTRRAA